MIQIRITGWAGQGVMLAGRILADTFSEGLHKNVIMTRSYTSAVRSGVATSDIIVDDNEIDELAVTEPDVMIVMDQRALDASADLARKSKCLLVDSTVVTHIPDYLTEVHRIGASAIAEKISSPKISNMVLLGAFSEITKDVPVKVLEEIVQHFVPSKFIESDLKAIESGFSNAL